MSGGRLSASSIAAGEILEMPHFRAMPDIGRRCHELRVRDANLNWQIIYRIDDDAIVILDVFCKKARKTPHEVNTRCHDRLKRYDAAN